MTPERVADPRMRVLMKVLPDLDDFGAYAYPLSEREADLIRHATDEEWDRARSMLSVPRRILDAQFAALEDLLGVIARNPGRVAVVAYVQPLPTTQPPCDGSSGSRGEQNPVAAEARRWGVPVEDYRTAVIALLQLGWITNAA